MKVSGRKLKHVALLVTIVTGLILTPGSRVRAGQTDLVGPPGSGRFGTSVTVLPNGNIVVTDPHYDAGSTVDVGAVYLYDGASGALISSLTGSTAGDQVGDGGVVVLTNGHYVVSSLVWDIIGATDAGAVTWGSGTIGITGTISSTNSLVGSTAGDQVGSYGVTALSNGNYVVNSWAWDNGGATDAGAVTWGNGTSGVSGVVSSTNSLVGSTANDRVGYFEGVVPLSNGNYVVESSLWANGGATNAGAVTWANGTTGITGTISSANSLVGSTTDDSVGRVEALVNGNYVVWSPDWSNGGAASAGAVTWGNGTIGVSGVVSSTNSLVGSTAGDTVSSNGVTALSNGNYIVASPWWDNGGVTDAGAATWGNGTTGTSGVISSTNSLVGSTTDDQGGYHVTALSNGNYVVESSRWDNGGATNAGAVTWADGTTGITGTISSANSLVGSTTDDRVGSLGATALSNGNYVVTTWRWDNGGATNAGAVTWGNGTVGISGAISAANSLVGSKTDDEVGSFDVTALSNGNYVVRSPLWDNGGATNAGAATWGNGTTGTSGVVSSANSLVGGIFNDRVGFDVTALSNGHYVVRSRYWANGGATDAGAATWGNGTTGAKGTVSSANSLVGYWAGDVVGDGVTALSNGHYIVWSPWWNNGGTADAGMVAWGNGTGGTNGLVSSANSLVGSTTDDQVGYYGGVVALDNDNYVVWSPYWDNGGATDAGAVTWGNGAAGTRGSITGANSVRGTASGGGPSMVFAYDDTNDQLVVGRPADNMVSFFANDAPVAAAGSDQGVNTGTLVTLDGSGSNDPDGNLPLTYGWTQTGGPAVTFTPSLSVTAFTAPGDPAVLTFSLVVTDALGLPSGADKATITVTNQAPVAAAGNDQGVDTFLLVTLDGSGSSDPDDDLPLTYHWTQAGGPAVTFSEALSITTFTAPGDPGVLTFTLTVTDALGLPSEPDEVVTTVTNQAPIADAGTDQSAEPNALITLDGSGSSDPDGDLPLAYTWAQTGGPSVTFTEALSITSFAAPTGSVVLTFTLTITDALGLASAPDEVVISVTGYRVYLPLVVRAR